MAVEQFNLRAGQRAERKLLITVAEWDETTTVGTTTTTTQVREFLGTRTEDSSIEYNSEIETTTDILGNNYTDMQRTQPEQTFDASPVIGGDKLKALLNDIRRRNALSELQQFTIYVITAFVGSKADGYACEKHTDCTITYDSIGGDVNVNFPYTVHFSNKITTGTVDKLAEDFVFTADATV